MYYIKHKREYVKVSLLGKVCTVSKDRASRYKKTYIPCYACKAARQKLSSCK